MESRQYKDVAGNPVTLDWLVRNEPEWAANQIRHRDKLESELKQNSGEVIVAVPMTLNEALVLLKTQVKDFPHPLPHNFQYKQWDLMLENLEQLEREVLKAKRCLSAISKSKLRQ